MTKYFITVNDICNHNPDSVEVLDFATKEEADEYAYQKALENAESYGGLHGTPNPLCELCGGSGENEEDGNTCSECDGSGENDTYSQEVEDEISYSTEVYDPEKHNELLEGWGGKIPS